MDRTEASPGDTRTPGRFDGVVDAGVRAMARVVGAVSRTLRLGGGTSAPGLVVQKLAPEFVARRGRGLSAGVFMVSGTNGKTTTTAMIKTILAAEGLRCVSNDSGANLFRGIATALVRAPRGADAAAFEVDEGAVARLVPMLRPRVLVLTNVFRDQLDRFGEPETVAKLLAEGSGLLGPDAKVVANADDSLLWDSVQRVRPDAVGFGVSAGDRRKREDDSAGEPEICPRCGGMLEYQARTFAHLGQARCPRCGWRSAEPAFRVELTERPRLGAMPLRLEGVSFVLPLGGLHNAYNAAAALAAAAAYGIPAERAARALQGFHAKFGRIEELDADGRPVWVALMKNPGGAGALVDQVLAEPDVASVLVCVSDQDADGRDISWIWDANFEDLAASGIPIVAGGRRAAEVAVRMKYAGATVKAAETDPGRAIRAALDAASGPGPVVILATYTAMLDVRGSLLGSRVARVSDVAA